MDKFSNSQKLPEGWSVKTLNDLGSFSKGKGIIKNDLVEEGLPCIRYAEIYTIYDFVVKNCKSFISQEVANTSKAIEKNTILFAGSGETKEEIGKSIAYIGENPAYAGGDNILFVPQKEIDCIFLSYFLNTIGRKQLNCLGQGDSIVHIRAEDLKRYVKIPFPSLPEQKAIAGTLGIWDVGIEKLSQLIKLKEKQKKAIMQKILTGKTRLNGFSKPWKEVKLGEVCERLQQEAIKEKQLIKNGEFPVINSGIDLYGFYNRANNRGNAVIISSHGVNAGFVSYIGIDFWAGALCHPYRSRNENVLSTKFLYFYLKSVAGTQILRLISGSGIPFINRTKIEKLKITVPADIEEQRAIAGTLSVCDEELALLNKKLALLREQKKSLMQQLLTGKMRLRF